MELRAPGTTSSRNNLLLPEAAYEMARCAKPVGNESQIHPDRDRSARRRRLAPRLRASIMEDIHLH